MLAAVGYKTKKELKNAKGERLRYSETSMIGTEYKDNGDIILVGPSAYVRKWFATVTMEDGKIKKVV